MALVTYVLGDCPGCGGKSTYGNVDVYSTHVYRGCGRCRYAERIPLPPIRKSVLYLDQFFFSHTFRGSKTQFVDAAEKIKELTSLQLLVVPYSTVHEEETHQWARSAELLEFIKSTARGYEFVPAYDVERMQLEKSFEAWLDNSDATYVCEDRDAFEDDFHVWDGYFRIDVGRYLGDIELVRSLKQQSVNELIALFDRWRQSEGPFEADLLAEHEDSARTYWRYFGEYVKRLAQGDYNALFDAPIMSLVVQRLLLHVPDEVPEDQRLKKVGEFLMSEHFRNAPYQDLSSRIFATLKAMVRDGAYQNTRKATSRLSGIFHDVRHVATYGPYCDAIVIDGPMAELVRKPTVSISDRYGVKIFSVNNWDEMRAWFDELKTSMTVEHRRALAEAYPRRKGN